MRADEVERFGFYVFTSRPRDDYVGPVFGPYEHVHIAHNQLVVSPFGHPLAIGHGGQWVLTNTYYEAGLPYDGVIVTDISISRPTDDEVIAHRDRHEEECMVSQLIGMRSRIETKENV